MCAQETLKRCQCRGPDQCIGRSGQHEHEELKEGTWLEPVQALLRKKVKENCNHKHCNVARKIFLEGGWTQKRLSDIGWSDVSLCQACQMEEGTEKHRPYHCPVWCEIRREIPEAFSKWEQKARTSKKEWKWQRGLVAHPLSESQRNRGHFRVKKWESKLEHYRRRLQWESGSMWLVCGAVGLR